MRPTDVFNPSDVLRPTDWFAIELAGSDWSDGWEKFNSGMVDGVVGLKFEIPNKERGLRKIG